MNPDPPSVYSLAFRARVRRRVGKRSATLVIVLSVLVLLLVLIVGFFAAATKMASSSQRYAAGYSALSLSQSAVGIVTSQIRLATAGEPTVTWTSQPGLLRTFDNTGAAQQIYKLYSAPVLTAPATAAAAAALSSTTPVYTETDDTPAANWDTTAYWTALNVDINRPSLDATGTNLVYPIVDPNAALANASTGRLPVVGFTLGSAPGYNAGNPASATNNPAAMPVGWLYVLANGGIAVPQSVSAAGDVTFSATSPQPSAANPVVGRIAFWTDDDTCKINVNTASYSTNDVTSSTPYMTYWDTPARMSYEEEFYLSRNQPVTNEFQRYPGHPATTGLNLVLPELTNQQIFALSPYYLPGGSGGGTTNVYNGTGLPRKQARLYASVDELYYSTNYSSGRGTNNLGTLSIHDLDTKRFFLTAQSRAPEVNLFGEPRVTIWPEWDIVGNRSTLDGTIAFCSTAGGKRYYFTRHDPNSQTTDISLSDGYGSNPALFGYLQRMTGRPIPGFGGTANGFLDKYGADRDQILADIFDTIRITNLSQTGSATPYTSDTNSTQVMGQVLPTIIPATITTTAPTRGAGRMPVITEAALIFMNNDSSTNGAPASNTTNDLQMGILYKFYQPQAGAIAPGCNFYYKSGGLTSLTVNDDKGLSQVVFPSDTYYHTNFEYNFTSIYGGATVLPTCNSDNYRQSPTNTVVLSGSAVTYSVPPASNLFRVTGKTFYFTGGTNYVEIHAPYNDASGTYIQKYIFVFPPISNALPVPSYFTNSTTGGLTVGGPWTNVAWTNAAGVPSFPDPLNSAYTNLNNGRFYTSSNPPVNAGPWISPTEVVRSVQLANGDVRAIAHMKDVPSSSFQPTPNYYSSVVAEHSLESYGLALGGGTGPNGNSATNGTLINGLIYGGSTGFNLGSSLQDVPVGMNGVTNSTGAEGDWDNGFGAGTDGAYLPKADEGVTYGSPTGDQSLWGYFVKNNGVAKLMYLGLSPTMFSANRQVSSAVEFGEIPTGVQRGLPWQTLLFRPARSYHMGGTSHPGAASPPDYLLLDLFQMPVVEPYAISEPFSTAGKANMNYRIKPFSSYITRDTAVRSVLQSTMIAAIPRAAVYGWRPDRTSTWLQPMYPSPATSGADTRFPVDPSQTLLYFETRFNGTSASGPPPVFVSESEICNIDLIPQGWTTNTIGTFWDPGSLTANNSMRFTGDNNLEHPYSNIYPRLTTRSNTYTVHVYSEALTPAPSSAAGWNESTGVVTGQWRGEYCLERYIDPNDPTIANFQAADANLNTNYFFHTLYTKRFAP